MKYLKVDKYKQRAQDVINTTQEYFDLIPGISRACFEYVRSSLPYFTKICSLLLGFWCNCHDRFGYRNETLH